MTDSEFVVRVSHILLSNNLWEHEKMHLIRLSYLEMAFPEKNENKETYNKLIEKLYNKD
jgi:hypothetical protein